MKLSSTLHRVTHKLIGQPCWNVQPGLHPCLTLELGAPFLELYEPQRKTVQRMFGRRTISVKGEYHLWTYASDWVVHSNRKQIGSSQRKKSIGEAARSLDGQIVDAIELKYRGCQTVIHFDFGGRLTLTPRSDAFWMLFTPRRMVLKLRSDKMFAYQSSNTDPSAENWKPAWQRHSVPNPK